jgi:hypothetical protein
LTASSNGVHQASEGRDALGVRIEVLAIFLFRNFSQCFPLDDFALRTILKTALNIAMHRSRDVFERSKRERTITPDFGIDLGGRLGESLSPF